MTLSSREQVFTALSTKRQAVRGRSTPVPHDGKQRSRRSCPSHCGFVVRYPYRPLRRSMAATKADIRADGATWIGAKTPCHDSCRPLWMPSQAKRHGHRERKLLGFHGSPTLPVFRWATGRPTLPIGTVGIDGPARYNYLRWQFGRRERIARRRAVLRFGAARSQHWGPS